MQVRGGVGPEKVWPGSKFPADIQHNGNREHGSLSPQERGIGIVAGQSGSVNVPEKAGNVRGRFCWENRENIVRRKLSDSLG
jgi:hypothetical protein